MQPLRKPALAPSSLTPHTASGYPEPYRSRVLPREKRRLAHALGLTKIGVNLTTLPAGKESSMRHWHTHEDELVYVLEGEVVLRTDAGEQLLSAGMCAGFPAGIADGHQLVNRSTRAAIYLEIGNCAAQEDIAHYADADVDMVWNGLQARGRFARRDGSPF
jgi:uncharacterized cupin superfamily protein